MGLSNVKQGDAYQSWSLGEDLTDATVQVRARLRGSNTTLDLTTLVTNVTAGIVRATVSGLDVGLYDVETVVTRAGVTLRFPDYGFEQLSVNERL